MIRTIAICTFLFLIGFAYATTPRSQAEITSLPGLNFTPSFKQYSGYVTVNEEHGRNLFYWFQESQNDPANDPVVMWINGGPGCSSAEGFLQENGAFQTKLVTYNNGTTGVELHSNFFAWNRAANMLYIDSPAGVGFSYSTNPSHFSTNDNQTAIDSTHFLESFFQDVFPEFANNPFWITGESYAGIYITTLSYNILTNSSDAQLVSSFKKGGMMLGNPVTGCEGKLFQGEGNIRDTNTQFQLWYWHGMVSPRVMDMWGEAKCDTPSPPSVFACDALYANAESALGRLDQPLMDKLGMRRPLAPSTYEKRQALAKASTGAEGKINPDSLYFSFCVGNTTLRFTELSNAQCESKDDQMSAWLNNPDVQSALHARPTHWKACGGVSYRRNVGSVIPYLEQIFKIAPGLRILYYSGDIDIATVPFGQTFRCLETMKRPIIKSWRPYLVNSEIGGYVEVYDTYTLATIKGAPHEAPAGQPATAFHMFTSFLNDKPF
mmetsp:Transcript_20728/g.30833  ORF Transcript_20728/g.30833 Transcript_20728/m.30833 type:complete len:492 (-) Transcript_20728:60-1535(-)